LHEDGNILNSLEESGRERRNSGDVEQTEGEQARSKRIGLGEAK
jgi:hypothetical protein